ncbi:hypothetical protein PV328_002145 [Microctonus aethiopoides]|uniref:Peptidase M12B domain-containing protein n=1 Tax=Microctonus aethiopoides TaxID=144406 RepID=A0AA39FYF9_9HYME|nr:hypothetical protein PV328_002145 [Microctonus aethiopoides]
MFIHVCIFFITITLSSSRITKIHNEMTEDELRLIFKTSRDKVPAYEIVSIVHDFQKRSISSTEIIKLRAFDKDLELYLHPTDGALASINTPVWTVKSDPKFPHGVNYELLKNPFQDVGKPYQDISTQSAVVLQKSKFGLLQIYGKILSDYVVHPLPYRLLNRVFRSKRDLNMTRKNYIKKDYHIIYRLPETKSANNGIRIINRDRASSNNFINGQFKRAIPETIFPELLIILDNSLYVNVGNNHQSAIQYLLSFWNAVDLRYRIINKPQIRLNLAAFILSISEGGTPYLDNFRRGDSELDADKALEAMSYAYEAGACNRSYVDQNTEAVAIVEDNGGYSAVLPATHEVAHLLGSPHDGLLKTSNCPGYDGYIMTSAVTFGENSFHWSSCSRKAFDEFFNSVDSECLFDVPQDGSQVLTTLPGKLKSLDEQCEKVYGSRAVCTRLECYMPEGGGFCKAVTAAAEGSSCGEEMHCIRGQCIPDKTNEFTSGLSDVKPELPKTGNDLPPYEVVPVLHSMNNKNVINPEVYLKAFNDNMSLYLWPAEGLLFGKHTPVYTVESDQSSPQGLRYTKYSEYGLYYVYQDKGNNAAIIIRHGKNDSYKFDGTIGKNLIIRSLPERIIEEIINKNSSFYNSNLLTNSTKTTGIYTLTEYHIIFKTDPPDYKFRHTNNITVIR